MGDFNIDISNKPFQEFPLFTDKKNLVEQLQKINELREKNRIILTSFAKNLVELTADGPSSENNSMEKQLQQTVNFKNAVELDTVSDPKELLIRLKNFITGITTYSEKDPRTTLNNFYGDKSDQILESLVKNKLDELLKKQSDPSMNYEDFSKIYNEIPIKFVGIKEIIDKHLIRF